MTGVLAKPTSLVYSSEMDERLQARVRERRRALGLSVSDLARRVGISRQALTAIEAGRAAPSTVTSLRLAKVLGCGVEDLFCLWSPQVPGLTSAMPEGARVALGRVGDRWVAHPVSPRRSEPADGIVSADGTVEVLGELGALDQTALIAGCAPVLGLLAGPERGPRCRWIGLSSRASLEALRSGRVHVAGLHLADRSAPEMHDDIVRSALEGWELEVVTLVGWREGLVVAPGNPEGVRGVADLERESLRIAMRPDGAGATRVLRAALAEAGVSRRLAGPEVASHRDAALAVLHGAVDAAVVVEPIAQAYGLPFLPLAEEAFELVVPVTFRDHPGVRLLFDRIAASRFVREIRSLGAYDTSAMGMRRSVCA